MPLPQNESHELQNRGPFTPATTEDLEMIQVNRSTFNSIFRLRFNIQC